MIDVRAAYLWPNGNLMVFDENGEQIPELQGPYDPVRHQAIKDRAGPSTEWHGFSEQEADKSQHNV